MWGSHVIMPPVGQNKTMDGLYEWHPGVSRMKSLVRSVVWWPRMDQTLEERIRNCDSCQYSRHLLAAAPLKPREKPQRP